MNSLNLDDLLHPYLPQDQSVTSSKTTSQITPIGHKTLILALEVNLKDGTTLYLASKSPSPRDKVEDLVAQDAFRKELTFYSVIAANLKYYEEKENVEELCFIPKFFGGKLNSQSCESVLLLENLQTQGYKNMELGCDDLGTVRQVLKDLASLHSIPVALNDKDQKVFDQKVKRHLGKRIRVVRNAKSVEKIMKILETGEFEPYLSKIQERLEEVPNEPSTRVPFSTLIHANCYVKNIMVKELEGFKYVKLVDYKYCSFGSLAEDLIFFLYTSVDAQLLEEHRDGLVQFYHSNFVRVLEECKCDPTPFSLEGLSKEMKVVAKESQFANVLFTLCSILGAKQDPESVKIEQKILFVVRDFIKRDWL